MLIKIDTMATTNSNLSEIVNPHPSDAQASNSPFHAGEIAVQRRIGVREVVEKRYAKLIRNHMPDQHRLFFAQLPMLLVASVDGDGQPWASVLCAPPGFIDSPDATHLCINTHPLKGDPLDTTLAAGCELGLLGIELPTRRRNRANGVVQSINAAGFTVAVRESFGNCAKYIQARTPEFADSSTAAPAISSECTDRLNERMRHMILGADTYFIASAYSDTGRQIASADVSHRGGRPGFVRVDDATTLTAPEFIGNSYFNTTGNLLTCPRAGLLFIDFDCGDLLYLAADVEVIWDGPEVERYAGAQRLFRFHIRRVLLNRASLPLRWGAVEFSPALLNMGSW